MKTLNKLVLSTISILTICITEARSQDIVYNASPLPVQSIMINTRSLNNAASVNEKVVTDFGKRFSDATDMIWSSNEGGSYVYFKQNGIPTRAIYSDKSKLRYTIRYYHGGQVPSEVVRIVGRGGYHMNVTDVTEITDRYTKSLFVVMEDKTSFVTVQVHPNGELSVYKEIEKQVDR